MVGDSLECHPPPIQGKEESSVQVGLVTGFGRVQSDLKLLLNNALLAWSPDPLSLEIEGCGRRD